MKRMTMILAGLVVLAGGAYVLRTLPAPTYPKRAAYAAMGSNGGQFVRAGVVDTAVCRRFALNDYIIIEPHRARATNASALRLVRQFNPKASILAYVKAGQFYVCGFGWVGQTPPPYGCDTTGLHQSWSRWVAIRAHNAVLWSTSGRPYLGGGYIDFARPGLAYALADSDAAWVPDYFTGIFADETCVSWIPGGDTIDYVRSGYPTLADWRRAHYAGVAAYFARLRERMGARLIVGNCGPQGSRVANGWMIEDWQNGHNVASYMARETTYVAPRQNWRTVWMHNPPTATDLRYARYALAVASLGEGVAAPTWSPSDRSRGWFDGLDLGADWRNWGRAKGAAARVPGSWNVWRREFERGTLTVDEPHLNASFRRRR